ncbi:MAG TPA: hypothetical protein EYN66_16400, partial [Myxococcales bacterium]|nr:hypothetical protein [Myxococcales bacterium]
TIQNQGDDDATTFQVDIFKDQKSNPGFGSPNDFSFIQEDGLGAGEERVLTIKNWKEAADGNYDSWVVVNTKNEINETDYSNNASGPRNVIIDGQGTLCPNNIELADILGQSCCSCGQKTVSEGFCCFGAWNFEAFDVCEDSGSTDGGTSGQDDLGNGINADGQGLKGPTYEGGVNLRGDKVGCQHSSQPASTGIAWGIFWMLALVALIRFKSLKQQ